MPEAPVTAKDRLIVALDVSTAAEAFRLADQLAEHVGMFKIGSQLFTAAGPDVVRQIVRRGGRVFLDLKYHDIPNTVAHAGVEAARLGVSMFDIHTSGGSEMIRATVEAVGEACARESLPRPLIAGITILTSLDQPLLAEIGLQDEVTIQVARLANLAASAGLDALVASPKEAGNLKQQDATRRLLLITPGIRPASALADDQRRTLTAKDAIAAGTDFLVVGRPIVSSRDPAAAAAAIVEEIQKAIHKTV